MRAFEYTARATAIAWRCPPESAPTASSTEGTSTPISASASAARRRISRWSNSRSGPRRSNSRFKNMLW